MSSTLSSEEMTYMEALAHVKDLERQLEIYTYLVKESKMDEYVKMAVEMNCCIAKFRLYKARKAFIERRGERNRGC